MARKPTKTRHDERERSPPADEQSGAWQGEAEERAEPDRAGQKLGDNPPSE